MKNPYLYICAFGKHNGRLVDLVLWGMSKINALPVQSWHITDYTNYLVGPILNSKY